jgi:hypothetical protein
MPPEDRRNFAVGGLGIIGIVALLVVVVAGVILADITKRYVPSLNFSTGPAPEQLLTPATPPSMSNRVATTVTTNPAGTMSVVGMVVILLFAVIGILALLAWASAALGARQAQANRELADARGGGR